MARKLILVIMILTLALAACDLHVTVPVSTVEPLATTEAISVPLPSGGGTVFLTLSFGTGTLLLQPGAANLVEGSATYNVRDFKPDISIIGSTVKIEQGNYLLDGIPDFKNIKNEWDLKLGAGAPLDLTIEGGANKCDLELGGLNLVNLTVQEGASQTDLAFTQPNLGEMNLLRYETGASTVNLSGLANANFSILQFSGGAGSYTLDFSGTLRRSGSVVIETGLSSVKLVIPDGIPVQLSVQGGLANVSTPAGWTQTGDVYTAAGTGAALNIILKIGAGNVSITH